MERPYKHLCWRHIYIAISGTYRGFRIADLPCAALAQHEPTNPEALARVLGARADVSNRKLTNITVAVGINCSWLAAVSQWLLSLHIEIRLSSGERIYQSPRA